MVAFSIKVNRLPRVWINSWINSASQKTFMQDSRRFEYGRESKFIMINETIIFY